MKNISINIVWLGVVCIYGEHKKKLHISYNYYYCLWGVYDKLYRYLKLIGVLYIFDLLLIDCVLLLGSDVLENNASWCSFSDEIKV